MNPRRAFPAHLVLCGIAFLVAVGEANAGRIICCENEQGKRVCADSLPKACYGRSYRVIGADGTVLETVAAPMTREQRLEAERLQRRKELEEARRRSQRLQDRALLDTYQSAEDIDARERRAVDEFKRDLDKAKARMAELKVEEVKLKEESKLYPDGDIPVDLREAINDNTSEQSAQQTVVEAKEKSIEAVRARFARDRERYKALNEGLASPR